MYIRRGVRYVIFWTLIVLLFYIILQQFFDARKSSPVYFRKINSSQIDRGNLLNLNPFRYVINTDCDTSFLVWVVTSYAADVSARSALRRAYSEPELQELGVRRVFLLALLHGDAETQTHVTQNAILDEARRYNDIVQGNFIEAYKNLTYKHVMGLKWATRYCKNASYVMKMDHDIVVDLYKIIEVIKTASIAHNVVMGYVLRNMIPVREPMNKWFVTRDEFVADFYPDFLSGWLYVTTPKTAKDLVDAAQIYPKYFWIDDLFLTGIIREELGIKFHDIHEIYTTNNEYLNCCLKARAKKFKCDFAIGPNGGDTELQVRFKEFAEYCRSNCFPRPTKFSVNNTCIVAWHDPNLGRGEAQVFPLQLDVM
ncbi:beta-1,3-galactosyltransferase 5 [Diprion similis]|uniref:beta-1,3-galactosyltransferase 5 n=1 Tax=Diprion similis TaxID=362088 RepID=UPI001EF8F822|nr:beta-1,3-galactosyltransferase 5 [Diprion similis]